MAIRLTETRLRQIIREEISQHILKESTVDFVAQNYLQKNVPLIDELRKKQRGYDAAVAELWPRVKASLSPRIIKNAIAKHESGARHDLDARIRKSIPDFSDVAKKYGLYDYYLGVVIAGALLNGMPDPDPTSINVASSSPTAVTVTDSESFRKALESAEPELFDELESGDFESPGELMAFVRMAGKKIGVTPQAMSRIIADIRSSMIG